MSELLTKKFWTKLILGDCCKQIAQRVENPAESGYERFVGLEHLEPGETSIRNWGNTEDVTSSMKLFKTGDVIVARRNVYLRRAARAGFDGVCSGDGIVLRANAEVCHPELLAFLLNTGDFWDYVTSQADGGMSKRITVTRLLSYEFHLPPLEEQRRMAEVLQVVELCMQSNADAQARLQEVKVAIIDTWIDTLRAQGVSPLTLLEVARCEPNYGLNAPGVDFDDALPRLLRITDIDDDGNLTEEDPVSVVVDNPKLYRIEAGDLLLARTGNTVGKAYLGTGTERNTVFAGYLVRFALDTDFVNPRYVFAHTKSSHYWSWVRQTSRVGAQPNINAKEYGKLPLWLPDDKAAQETLVSRIDTIEKAKQALSNRFSHLISIKKRALLSLGSEGS